MRTQKWYSGWLMVLPALAALGLFSLYPAVRTIISSFTNERVLTGGHFIGLDNYVKLFQDDQLRDAIVNTLLYMVICVPLLTILPLLVAMLVAKPLRGITFFRTIFYFPVIASAVVVAVIWQWMLNDRGLFNQILQSINLTSKAIPFLSDRWLLLFACMALTVWKGIGYYMIIYLSALANVPPTLHEAASMDGAGAFRRFLSVTLPSIRGTMLLVATLTATSAMRIFTELYILGGPDGGVGGQDQSVVMLIQRATSAVNGRVGYASTLSVLLFFMTLIPLLVMARLNRNSR